MDIRSTSAAAYTPPVTNGRSGSSESLAASRRVASDSLQERKEAESSSAMRQTAQKQNADYRANQSADSQPAEPARIDIRV